MGITKRITFSTFLETNESGPKVHFYIMDGDDLTYIDADNKEEIAKKLNCDPILITALIDVASELTDKFKAIEQEFQNIYKEIEKRKLKKKYDTG